MTPLAYLIESFDVQTVFYADDAQLPLTYNKTDEKAKTTFSGCFTAVRVWLNANLLQCNLNKNKNLLFGKGPQAAWLGACPSSWEAPPTETAKTLGYW